MFQWIDECEAAFQKLKNMLATLPILTRPVEGIPILIYLAISNEAIGAALVHEFGNEQRSIYFINKVAHALIITTRKLRLYLQSHKIVNKMELPIKQVLKKPNLTKRMVGWYVELLEFNISNQRQGHVKTQVLVDFITKLTSIGEDNEETNEWSLLVDGASN
ncbi:hypothetical protein CR513_49985, partial [Mucuna pruriens]